MIRGSEPEWVRHAIWWQTYPLGAVGADMSGADRIPAHRLDRLIPYLDHLVSLGANGLLLGPVFASSTHGYDTLDWYAVDPRLGDDADLDRLFAAARERGVRVLLDGVFNHVGRDARVDPALLARDAEGRPVPWEGIDLLVELDHSAPAVEELVVDVMCHWLERGASGWRLDVAYAVPTRFWARVLPRVRARFPDAWFLGEVLHGDYAGFVAESTVDTVTQYELWKAVWSSLESRNLWELDWALQRHAGMLETFVPATFVGNHDVTRLATAVSDPRHRAHAAVVLFTVGGTPIVYYGDEVGLEGLKEERIGGDDAIRPELPPDPADLRGDAALLSAHRELIALRRRHPWLHSAVPTRVALTNETAVYDVAAEGLRMRVLLNLADEPLRHAAEGAVLAGDAHSGGGDAVVPPHGWAVVG